MSVRLSHTLYSGSWYQTIWSSLRQGYNNGVRQMCRVPPESTVQACWCDGREPAEEGPQAKSCYPVCVVRREAIPRYINPGLPQPVNYLAIVLLSGEEAGKRRCCRSTSFQDFVLTSGLGLCEENSNYVFQPSIGPKSK